MGDVGPMISPEAMQRAYDLVESGVQQGVTLLLDGRNVTVEGYPNGNWMGPTILDNVTTDMDCYKEEIFGPVLVCLEVDTVDEAIALVNKNRWGNGTATFTNSSAAAHVLLHGQQGLICRRPQLLRQGRRAVLHTAQDDHEPVATRRCRRAQGRNCHAHHEVERKREIHKHTHTHTTVFLCLRQCFHVFFCLLLAFNHSQRSINMMAPRKKKKKKKKKKSCVDTTA